MTVASIPVVSPPKESTTSPDDAVFDFTTIEWHDAPLYVSDLPETTPDTNIREMTEMEYRKSTTPSNWHRYLTLGRYSVDGFTLDASMEDIVADPLKIHCIIWYQYTYHLDHDIEIPEKLLAWVFQRTQPYLHQNADSALILDTKKVSWKKYSRIHSLSDNWSVATQDKNTKKNHKKAQLPATDIPKPLKKASVPRVVNPYAQAPVGAGQQVLVQTPQASVDSSIASEGTDLSLLTNTSNVRVCDGTKRVTFRLKLTVEEFRYFRVPNTMKESVYKFLNSIFGDDDGCLYDWGNKGTDKFGTISQMTPQQVRDFICPSVTLMPDSSLVILPIRFGFNGQSPSKWRNLVSTQNKLDEYNATVSFSNASSTSGKLVIAGYVLYKAPMTTHRKRWLEYLRTLLDEDTPPFDVLLHKRPPTGDKGKVLPHLAIQCGEAHVHSLSEALAALLTGEKYPLYLPRFSFQNMTAEEAYSIFLDHDTYAKDLRSYPLSPLLRNLDRIRKEFHPNGKVIERSAREWARNLQTYDGTYMQADVVNGGDDLLCYLVYPSVFSAEAARAVDEYRSLLYPFTQREARFRESVGPPPEVHLSKRVIANLDFVKRRIAANKKSTSVADAARVDESDSTTTSSISQASRPMTPAESLRHRYRQNEQSLDDRSASSTSEAPSNSTSSTTAASSKQSNGQISSQSAQLRDLQSALTRQKKASEKQDTQTSERLSTIERQLYRFDDMDTKLTAVCDDFSSRLNLLEGRILQSVKAELTKSSEAIDTRMERLLTAVESVVASQKDITKATMVLQQTAPSVNSDSSSNESNSSATSTESNSLLQSPENKRQKSGEKKLKKLKLKDSIRRILDDRARKPPATNPLLLEQAPDEILQTHSDESMEHIFRQMDEIAQHTFRPDTSSNTHDPESQYTACQEKTDDLKAPPSPGRGQSS